MPQYHLLHFGRIICKSRFENGSDVYQIQFYVSHGCMKHLENTRKETLCRRKVDTLKQNVASLFNGNTEFNTMCAVASALVGRFQEIWARNNWVHSNTMNWGDRTFSRYKVLLLDNSQSYTSDNLWMVFVTHRNAET